MNKPDYLAPRSLAEALKALGEKPNGVQIIAGGTDLIPRMRSGVVEPSLLVDLRLLGLDGIEMHGNGIRMGASTTHTGVLESALLAEYCPALVESAKDIAGPPIRNRGTVGGNLVNASPAADLAPPLLVYDALVVLAQSDFESEVSIAEFFTGPGQTMLAMGEILTEVRIPAIPKRTSSAFIKLGKRRAMAIAVVSAAARLTLNEVGVITQARIALGSVAPTPIRSMKAEASLIGQTPNADLFAEAGQIASTEVTPISDLRASGEYRGKMVAVLTRRALAACWKRIEEGVDG